jgi:hypothetical protein
MTERSQTTESVPVWDFEKQKLKSDMDILETLNRLEPNVTPCFGENTNELSIAISLKRIADAFDRRTPGEAAKEAHIKMVRALSTSHRKLGFSASMKLVGDYFRDLIGIQTDEL